MAIRPSESDTFMREVDEELRKDQLNRFVARYGWWLIAGIIAFLAAIGGFLWWQERQRDAAAEQGNVLLEAVEALDGSDAPTREAILPKVNGLIESPVDGYRAAGLFARATLEEEGGNRAAAIATLRTIAEDMKLAEPYRHAALVRQTLLEFDQLQPQVVIQRLGPIARPGSAWHGSAGELVGIAHMKMNRPNLAGPIFAGIARDETVPPSIRTRAVQMAGSLGINAVPDSIDSAPAAAPPPAATREAE